MIFYYQYISKQIPTDKHWNCQVLFLKVWHLTSYYRYVFMMTSLKKITGMNTFCTKSLKWLNTGHWTIAQPLWKILFYKKPMLCFPLAYYPPCRSIPKPSRKIRAASTIFWIYLGIFRDYNLKNIHFVNKTFLFFKIKSWNFQNLFEKWFCETSQNLNSIRQPIEKMKMTIVWISRIS